MYTFSILPSSHLLIKLFQGIEYPLCTNTVETPWIRRESTETPMLPFA
jgi:hypothetical protein